MGSTNYYNTLIEIADDSPISTGEIPPSGGKKKSIATLQYEMLYEHPYEYTSDDVLFTVWATRKGIPHGEREKQRDAFFAKDQACFRASPLTKRYGWGVHSDSRGMIAIYAAESSEYQQLIDDETIQKKKAMRSKRAK